MTSRSRSVLVALVIALGCGSDDGGDEGQGEDTTGSPTTTTGTATATTSTSATTTASTSATTSATSTTDTTTDDGPMTTDDGPLPTTDDGGDPSSDDGGSGSCEIGPDDDACRECVKGACCDIWTNCMNDDVCACTIDCHLAGASLGSCKNECCGDSELYEAVFFCGQQTCLGTCEWDCC